LCASVSLSLAADWPNGPVKALYIDDNIDWTTPAITFQTMAASDCNLIVLAFMVSGVLYDAQSAWAEVKNQTAVVNYIHDQGARIIASAGGATDTPYGKMTGAAYGSKIATWAKDNHLDGVDFDLENFGSGFTAGGLNFAATVQWVVDATNAARSVLGASGIITHAPQTPYFGTKQGFNNGYVKVYEGAPSINFFLVQFYNNGPSTTYASIFTSNNGASVAEIKAEGIPLEKIVVGKPFVAGDAGNGYVSPATLHTFFAQAKSELGWNAGVMAWQWHSASATKTFFSTIFP